MCLTSGDGWTGVDGTGKHQLVVDGNTGDTVTVDMAGGSWTNMGDITNAGITYHVYESANHQAQLLLDSSLQHTGAVL